MGIFFGPTAMKSLVSFKNNHEEYIESLGRSGPNIIVVNEFKGIIDIRPLNRILYR